MELLKLDKQMLVLMELYNRHEQGDPLYKYDLAKRLDITYSHTVKVLELFSDNGLVRFEKEGRNKYIYLTKSGRRLGFSLLTYINVKEGIIP